MIEFLTVGSQRMVPLWAEEPMGLICVQTKPSPTEAPNVSKKHTMPEEVPEGVPRERQGRNHLNRGPKS